MTPHDLHPHLERPPQAITLSVRRLIQRVAAGGVRLPSFQRPLRWRAADVIKLFDSINRGYPIGALLFWKHPAKEDPAYRVGSATLSVPSQHDAWWIVDGQQRVTALAASLLELDHGEDPRWTVHFDPQTGEFASGPVPDSKARSLVPLAALGDLKRLGRWIRAHEIDDDIASAAEDAQQRILDYELSAYVVEADDPGALRGVFARMNSTGVRMRADEVFQALLGGDRPGDLDLNQLQLECDLEGFGQPPRGEILKAVLAISGHDPTKRPEALGEGASASVVGPNKATDALVRAVTFLREDAHIPAYAFIPYPVVFVLLARWFHVFPSPARENRGRLTHWLWRGVITATHQRAAVSKLREQVRMMRAEGGHDGMAEDRALRALEAFVGSPGHLDWSLERFHASNARSRVEVLTLLDLKPRHRDGSLVRWSALLSGGQRVAREVFPSEAWKKLPADVQALARTSANRVLLDDRHTGLVRELRHWSWTSDHDSLMSHLIDEDAFDAIQCGDITRFLRHRRSKLQRHVTDLLNDWAALEAPVLRPVEVYYEPPPGEE